MQARWWLMRPIRESQILPQRLQVEVGLSVLAWELFRRALLYSAHSLLSVAKAEIARLTCRLPMKHPGLQPALPSNEGQCCKLWGTYSDSLCSGFLGAPLSRLPVESLSYRAIFGRWWSSILATWHAQRNWWSLQSPVLDVGDEVTSSVHGGWSEDSVGGSIQRRRTWQRYNTHDSAWYKTAL